MPGNRHLLVEPASCVLSCSLSGTVGWGLSWAQLTDTFSGALLVADSAALHKESLTVQSSFLPTVSRGQSVARLKLVLSYVWLTGNRRR